jgi:electron transfer flavoprotein alpha/beta subunit
MNIVVLVKQVPDSGLARQLDAQLRVDRNGANNVMGELDEYAVEAALQLKEAHGGEVTVLTLGPSQATETIRKTLAMGADKAVHIEDDAVAGSDALTTSAILAAALGRLQWDLVIAGAESTDSNMGVMPQLLAARTGIPALTGARKIVTDGTSVTVEPSTRRATRRSRASWPPSASRSNRSSSLTSASRPPARPPPRTRSSARPRAPSAPPARSSPTKARAGSPSPNSSPPRSSSRRPP